MGWWMSELVHDSCREELLCLGFSVIFAFLFVKLASCIMSVITDRYVPELCVFYHVLVAQVRGRLG